MPSERKPTRYNALVPPLWISPFQAPADHQEEGNGQESDQLLEYDFYGLHTYPDKKPWSDLLIDISMTTAFNGLTNGTRILDKESCLSYISFFTLVWWVWTSRVAYDVRFSKGDWIHRVFLSLQFIIFCALSAFTKDFEIGYDLISEENEALVNEAQQLLNYTRGEINASRFRLNRLPVLNAKGVSLVLMLSRLLLFLQYLLVSCHAPKTSNSLSPFKNIKLALTESPFRSFQTHMLSLVVSSVFYLVAFIVLDSSVGSDKGAQIAKIILWYLPILMEIGAHYLAMSQPGHVPYPMKGIFERCAAAFVIILGGGLDNITEGFQILIGNSVIGGRVAALVFASAVIFLLQFSMYFEITSGRHISKKHSSYYGRTLTWFFFHFAYFASIIVLLQAIAAILEFEDVITALEIPMKFVEEANNTLIRTGADTDLTDNDFTVGRDMKKLGFDIGEFVDFVNNGIAIGRETNASEANADDSLALNTTVLQVANHAAMQGGVYMIASIFENFDEAPDPNDPLGSTIDLYLTSSLNSTDFPYDELYIVVVALAYAYNATPTLWFFGSAGATLIALSILSMIRWWKEWDGSHRFANCLKFSTGIATCLLSLLDLGRNSGRFSEDENNQRLKFYGSPIYVLITDSFVIPLFAIILACEQVIEFVYLFVKEKKLRARSVAFDSEEKRTDLEFEGNTPDPKTPTA